MSVPSFLIKNGSTDFLNKQRNLFDVLDSAEKEKTQSANSSIECMDVDVNKPSKVRRKLTKQFKGKDSLFNKPVELPPRFRRRSRVPDYQRNPHKWTKYSLGDVTQDDMSNASNTAAALSFLKEVKRQKSNKEVNDEKKETVSESASDAHLHTFNRPNRKSKESHIIEEVQPSPGSYFRNSKYIMSEYVVGQEKKPTKVKKKNVGSEKGKEIFLNHIHEYEDE
ncbi:hypothetical protein RUM43_001864 [Polyplax serrata]|uniref:U5 small nuclear ribonucleoprotein TSSC4 n=1 Tax=Polyplax serrata TaxID=468196 RepID=A0AAN8SFG2_POLSC